MKAQTESYSFLIGLIITILIFSVFIVWFVNYTQMKTPLEDCFNSLVNLTENLEDGKYSEVVCKIPKGSFISIKPKVGTPEICKEQDCICMCKNCKGKFTMCKSFKDIKFSTWYKIREGNYVLRVEKHGNIVAICESKGEPCLFEEREKAISVFDQFVEKIEMCLKTKKSDCLCEKINIGELPKYYSILLFKKEYPTMTLALTYVDPQTQKYIIIDEKEFVGQPYFLEYNYEKKEFEEKAPITGIVIEDKGTMRAVDLSIEDFKVNGEVQPFKTKDGLGFVKKDKVFDFERIKLDKNYCSEMEFDEIGFIDLGTFSEKTNLYYLIEGLDKNLNKFVKVIKTPKEELAINDELQIFKRRARWFRKLQKKLGNEFEDKLFIISFSANFHESQEKSLNTTIFYLKNSILGKKFAETLSNYIKGSVKELMGEEDQNKFFITCNEKEYPIVDELNSYSKLPVCENKNEIQAVFVVLDIYGYAQHELEDLYKENALKIANGVEEYLKEKTKIEKLF